jgi:hypothetical protein
MNTPVSSSVIYLMLNFIENTRLWMRKQGLGCTIVTSRNFCGRYGDRKSRIEDGAGDVLISGIRIPWVLHQNALNSRKIFLFGKPCCNIFARSLSVIRA